MAGNNTAYFQPKEDSAINPEGTSFDYQDQDLINGKKLKSDFIADCSPYN